MASRKKTDAPAASAGIQINRAPVFTLWAMIVAHRLGHDAEEAATLGRALAGMNAASKAKSLGLVEERTPAERTKSAAARKSERTVELMGRQIPIVKTPDGLRATNSGKPIAPASVHRYLESKFGEDLERVRAAMEALARSQPKPELAAQAMALYEAFRPEVPRGVRGWGAKGTLDLSRIRSLGRPAPAKRGG
jgi:hypothetical protein